MFKHIYRLSLIGCCLLGLCGAVNAEEAATGQENLCPPEFKFTPPKVDKALINDQRTYVDADSATIDNQNVTRFSGDVLIRQGEKQLRADEVTYNRQTNTVDAEGNIVFTTGEILLKGDKAKVNLEYSTGVINNTYYQTGTVNGRGTAKTVNVESKTKLSLHDATYTTCPPNNVVWQLKADEITVNNENHQGTATNAVLDIGSVPVMYLPYIRFPVGDQRLSGFLYPSLTVSNSNGTEIAIPYYWNIAPNMDATFTPDNMSKRGLMLGNEFRYMTTDNIGQIELDYLNQDKVYGANRSKFAWNHKSVEKQGWSTLVDYNYVSDDQYLIDFGNTLTTIGSSTVALNRLGSATYNQSAYTFSAALQDYQNISGTQQYKRLPQLKFNTRVANVENHLNYDFIADYNNFDINESNMVIGQRLLLNPYVAYPVVGNAGYIKPKVTLNYLQYSLQQPVGSTNPENPGLTLPAYSIDTGVYFDRETSIGDVKLIESLEPRLYYLYVPYKDQNSFPVFDTASTTFSQTLLFSENRFSGSDRIGDANQLTVALTGHVYRQDSGAELFNATLGQIFYFRNRDVVLPGQAVETSNRSNYLGYLTFTPTPHWSLNGDIQYDPYDSSIAVGNALIQYQPGPGKVINAEYRYTKDQLRTQGASFAWRLTPRWQMLGGSQYDLYNERRIQNFAGVIYDSCCWGVRVVYSEQFVSIVNNDPNNLRYEHAVYIDFVLKGLSSIGSGKDVDTMLNDDILGYSK